MISQSGVALNGFWTDPRQTDIAANYFWHDICGQVENCNPKKGFSGSLSDTLGEVQ